MGADLLPLFIVGWLIAWRMRDPNVWVSVLTPTEYAFSGVLYWYAPQLRLCSHILEDCPLGSVEQCLLIPSHVCRDAAPSWAGRFVAWLLERSSL